MMHSSDPNNTKSPTSSQAAPTQPEATVSPEKGGMTRRKAIGKILTYAGALGVGKYIDNALDSALANHENTEHKQGLPIRKAQQLGQTPNRLVDSLIEKGFTGFMFGDGHHQSAPVIKTITGMAAPDRHTFETFLEMTEPGKNNAATNEALKGRDSGVADEAYKVRSDYMRSVNGAGGKNHPTDSWVGPDHHHVGNMMKCAQGDVYTILTRGLPNLRGMIDGMERDMVFRNDNMAEAITRVMKNQPQDKLFTFIVGDAHLDPLAKNNVPKTLQANMPDRKIAVISVIPVKDQKFDQRVFSDSAFPNHFIITAFDKDKGLNISNDGHVDWDGKHLLLSNRQQGRNKE